MAYRRERFADFRWGITVLTGDGKAHEIDGLWDIVIAHPTCTFLAISGNRWFSDRYGTRGISRYYDRLEAINFFMKFVFCNAKRVAIENPVGIMSSVYRTPDQIVEPYWFGDQYEKKTCLWLKNLPKLEPTDMVKPEERIFFKSGKSHPAWYTEGLKLPKSERQKLRSKTFPGFAQAMAEQWGALEEG